MECVAYDFLLLIRSCLQITREFTSYISYLFVYLSYRAILKSQINSFLEILEMSKTNACLDFVLAFS